MTDEEKKKKILYNLLCCNFEKRDVKDILNCEQFTFDDLD